jgi:hypothetical protein
MDESIQAVREAHFRRSCDRYAARLAAGRVRARRDGDFAAQVSNYVAANARTHQIRSGTAAVLDAAGVSNIVRPYYYSFALALGRRSRELWSARQLAAEARILVELWRSRGLVHSVLSAIAGEVFGILLVDTGPAPCAGGAGAYDCSGSDVGIEGSQARQANPVK